MRVTEELLDTVKNRMGGVSFNFLILMDIQEILITFSFELFGSGSLSNFTFKLFDFALEFELCGFFIRNVFMVF